jgi:UDP-N-acetyl-D-galactosamine dehydrogenase
LGLTFKENISDIRNTKVIDIYDELTEYGIRAYVHDPYAYKDEVKAKFDIELIDAVDDQKPYDAVILAVTHLPYVERLDLDQIKDLSSGANPILVDVKSFYSQDEALQKGFSYWRL